jgi:hypothetical protein
MNDVSIARITGAFDIARVPLLALVGMSRPGRRCDVSRVHRTVRQLVGLVAMTLFVNATGAGAQTPVEPSSNIGAAVGMAVHRLQDNFALSGSWSSPVFFDGTARITAGGGVAWYPYGTTASGDQDWVPFGHSRVVVESGHRVGRAPLRLYGFGGAMLLFRSQRLSDDVVAVAGIGGFGFEFFAPTNMINAPVSYFIEIGGVGSGARATNLPGHPILLNGFLVQSGVRFYPCRGSVC